MKKAKKVVPSPQARVFEPGVMKIPGPIWSLLVGYIGNDASRPSLGSALVVRQENGVRIYATDGYTAVAFAPAGSDLSETIPTEVGYISRKESKGASGEVTLEAGPDQVVRLNGKICSEGKVTSPIRSHLFSPETVGDWRSHYVAISPSLLTKALDICSRATGSGRGQNMAIRLYSSSNDFMMVEGTGYDYTCRVVVARMI